MLLHVGSSCDIEIELLRNFSGELGVRTMKTRLLQLLPRAAKVVDLQECLHLVSTLQTADSYKFVNASTQGT